MKIDFSRPLTALDGSPIKAASENEAGEEILTLRLLAINVLLTTMVDERTGHSEVIPASEKVRYAHLAQIIYSANGPVEIKVEDVALLKERIGRAATPLAVARAWEILDPPELEGNTASDRMAKRTAVA